MFLPPTSLFEKCPEAKLLFGFPLEVDPRSEALLKSRRFMMQAVFFFAMIDKTVGMLGVNNDQLTKMLTDLGKKHVAYGVKPEYFPFMTESLLIMLKETLGDKFSDTNQEAWKAVFGVLIADMVKGQQTIDKGLVASENKAIVIDVWKRLTFVKSYKEDGGIILFQK
jgi:hemoglobin-like flavoprotein